MPGARAPGARGDTLQGVTQDLFLLLAVALFGVYAVGWTRRLAPTWSEVPLKTLLATLAAGAVVAAELMGTPVDPAVRLLVAVLATPFVAAPLLAAALARSRRYAIADAVVFATAWTREGREALRRLVVQAALQRGDAAAALERLPLPADGAMRAQAMALQGDWLGVVALPEVEEGDPRYLADGARVQALLALARQRDAERVAAGMRERFERGPQGPVGYRSTVVAESRVEAERGNLRAVREALQQPLVGVAPDEVYAIVARAAEVAGDRALAVRVYQEAARVAPELRRERYAERLISWGESVPVPVRAPRRGLATGLLAGVLVLAYAGQAALDLGLGALSAGGIQLNPSSIAAAFGMGLPGFPFSDAWWRYLSYAFVHGGLIHIGFNTWVLLDLGRLYEGRRGWGDLLAAFTVGTAMGAYLTSVAQAGETLLLVGASGGVLGVAGALLADVLRSRAAHDRALTRSLLQWIVLITLLSLVIPNVSLWGHVGGVVGGLLYGFVRQGLPAWPRAGTVFGLVGIAALAAALTQVLWVVAALL